MKTIFFWFSWFIITGGTTSYWFGGVAPGTVGSFFAGVLIYILYLCGWWGPYEHGYMYIMLFMYALSFVFIPVGEKFMVEKWGAGKKYGTESRVEHDLGLTVLDEYLGMFITSMAVLAAIKFSWIPYTNSAVIYSLIICVLSFRVFDISKCLGIKRLETYLKNLADKGEGNYALSIIADDVLAGIYAFILSLILISILVPLLI